MGLAGQRRGNVKRWQAKKYAEPAEEPRISCVIANGKLT